MSDVDISFQGETIWVGTENMEEFPPPNVFVVIKFTLVRIDESVGQLPRNEIFTRKAEWFLFVRSSENMYVHYLWD